MSVTVEKLEKSMAKLIIEVSSEEFDKAVEKVYLRQRNRINVPGFRKGKAPRKIIEKMYGEGVFFEDAANDCINATYSDAVKECGEEVVSNPTIDVTQLEAGKPFIYTAEVALKPPVGLGKYKGVEIEKREPVTVSEEEIAAELSRQQNANAKIVDVTDRPVKDGDMIKLDYAGTVDGVAFDGGTAQNADLTIGSGSFIPGFEDQLIGVSVDEEKDVEVTFPENYHEKTLAGKAAVFHCKVNGIKEKVLPELNDEFADEVSEFSTLDEYKNNIMKNLADRKENEQRQAKENDAVDAVIADAQIEIPDAMLRTQQEQIANEMAQNMQYQGLTFDQYLQYTGMTREAFLEQMKPQATKRIQTRLVLEEIVKAEGIEATDEDFEAELQKMADQYRMPVENVKSYFDSDQAKEDLKKDIAVQKAITFITDNAKEVEKKKEEADNADDAVAKATAAAVEAAEANA
ncbi:MAG: trigger factor [Lachnospiraceae bacterium]|nr:trigger factor [Lachnospiraceae bacterium]